MDSLINKYRKDKLTPEELSELRKKLDTLSDVELEEEMYAVWLNEKIDTSFVDDNVMNRIKENVHSNAIEKKRSGLHILFRWTQLAAVILLPVFILFSIYQYRENHLILSEEMIISTGKGERASIGLPEGSTVVLNSESRLGYLPKDYNKKERKINFSGEGYFQIHPDKKVPFFLKAKGLQVKVLGTTFNLSVRETATTAELALEEGSVMLSSMLSKKNVILQKNQKAILDHATGNITVIPAGDLSDVSAWRRGDMVFRNTELSQVLRTIEENYNVVIAIDRKSCLTDAFTGILPINDLNEVLEVIEQSYHLKAVKTGREIVLKSNK